MPGELRGNAKCPRCGDPLLVLSDLTSVSRGVIEREYFHDKWSPKARRRRRCKFTFTDFDDAAVERRRLEKHRRYVQ